MSDQDIHRSALTEFFSNFRFGEDQGAIVNHLYVQTYKARGTPHIKLSGLSTDIDLLYDGTLFKETTAWWNRFLDKRPMVMKLGWFRHYDANEGIRLTRTANLENRDLLVVIGKEHSPYGGKVGIAALALAYALARTMMTGMDYGEGREEMFEPAPKLDPDHLDYYSHRYGIEADYYGWDTPSPGWWAEKEQGGPYYARGQGWPAFMMAVPAIRWAYRNQVRRWEKAEGRKLGSGVGWARDEPQLLTDFSNRLFELGGRFYEAETA
jgi:hypothetical protein